MVAGKGMINKWHNWLHCTPVWHNNTHSLQANTEPEHVFKHYNKRSLKCITKHVHYTIQSKVILVLCILWIFMRSSSTKQTSPNMYFTSLGARCFSFPFHAHRGQFTDSARADSPDFSSLTAPEKRLGPCACLSYVTSHTYSTCGSTKYYARAQLETDKRASLVTCMHPTCRVKKPRCIMLRREPGEIHTMCVLLRMQRRSLICMLLLIRDQRLRSIVRGKKLSVNEKIL